MFFRTTSRKRRSTTPSAIPPMPATLATVSSTHAFHMSLLTPPAACRSRHATATGVERSGVQFLTQRGTKFPAPRRVGADTAACNRGDGKREIKGIGELRFAQLLQPSATQATSV